MDPLLILGALGTLAVLFPWLIRFERTERARAWDAWRQAAGELGLTVHDLGWHDGWRIEGTLDGVVSSARLAWRGSGRSRRLVTLFEARPVHRVPVSVRAERLSDRLRAHVVVAPARLGLHPAEEGLALDGPLGLLLALVGPNLDPLAAFARAGGSIQDGVVQLELPDRVADRARLMEALRQVARIGALLQPVDVHRVLAARVMGTLPLEHRTRCLEALITGAPTAASTLDACREVVGGADGPCAPALAHLAHHDPTWVAAQLPALLGRDATCAAALDAALALARDPGADALALGLDDPAARVAALRCAFVYPHPALEPRLIALLDPGHPHDHRALAAAALGQGGTPAALPRLRALAQDLLTPPPVRAAARTAVVLIAATLPADVRGALSAAPDGALADAGPRDEA